MAWGMVDIEEQRVRFVVSASRGERTMQELCREFEISRPTGYRWLRRYHEGGVAAVVEKSRRPHHSPERTARALEEHVLALRQQRPDRSRYWMITAVTLSLCKGRGRPRQSL